MSDFIDTRRQQFLTEASYEAIKEFVQRVVARGKENRAKGLVPKNDTAWVSGAGGIFDCLLDILALEYTAGKPIEELKAMYPAVVDAFVDWVKSEATWHYINWPEDNDGTLDPTPIELGDPGHYVQIMRLLGLGVLLHEGESLQRVAQALSYWRNEDTIVEELLAPYVPDPQKLRKLYHKDLYLNLIQAAVPENGKASAENMENFLKEWYPYFKQQPWHNAHMRIGENKDLPDWANYYGYWAFEAGALAYLYQLDDSAYRDEFMIYPKDLVAWARAYKPPVKEDTPAPAPAVNILRAEPGQPVPRGGLWETPAMLEPRSVKLNAGQTLPAAKYDKAGNAVVWFLKEEIKPPAEGEREYPDSVKSSAAPAPAPTAVPSSSLICKCRQPCPKTGFWFPVAPSDAPGAAFVKANARPFYIEKGDTMITFGVDGATEDLIDWHYVGETAADAQRLSAALK